MIAQLLGIIAIVVSVLSMIFKNKTGILLFSIIYNLLTLVSYLLLGKYLRCILVGVLTLKGLIYYIFAFKKYKPNIYVLIFFEILIVIVSIVLWQSWLDALILANSIINTYTTWQDNVKVLKISVVICSILLVLYDIFAGAYVYVISELLYGGTALITLLTMHKQNKKEVSKENFINKEVAENEQ